MRSWVPKNEGSPLLPVEAERLTKENKDELLKLCGGFEVEEIDALDSSQTYVGIQLEGPEGWMRASEGDYMIRSMDGVWHSRWPEAFLSMYKPKENEDGTD